MWYSNILVAYDGSAPSRKALLVARELAEQNPQAALTLVHAVRVSSAAGAGVSSNDGFFDRAHAIEEDLQRFADKLPNQTAVRLLTGTSPAEMILKCADDLKSDLIVMGSRGQGGVKGYLGSVSYAVVQRARACVLIAKEEPAEQ